MHGSRFILMLFSEEYVNDRRRQLEVDVATMCHDESHGQTRLIAVKLYESAAANAAISNRIARLFPGNRLPPNQILDWPNNDHGQELFYNQLKDLLTAAPPAAAPQPPAAAPQPPAN